MLLWKMKFMIKKESLTEAQKKKYCMEFHTFSNSLIFLEPDPCLIQNRKTQAFGDFS